MKTDAAIHEHPTHCLNCGGAVRASFCQYCGQETVLHVPSAREFLHEFIGHYVALEGKLWKSLGLLLFKPGRLTRDYIEGKRVRYVLPLRLYLTFSILFFALLKIGGYEADLERSRDKAPQVQVHSQEDVRRFEEMRNEGLDRARNGLDQAKFAAPRKLGETLDKFKAMSSREIWHKVMAAFLSYAPYAVFALMPVFALYLKILYLGSGRRYGEHLLFALHTNAFAFAMLSLQMITPDSIPLLGTVFFLWMVFYLPVAMRKVYGGSRAATALRWIVLMFLHLIGMLVGIAGAVVLGVTMA